MAKRLTTKEFIKRAVKIHGNIYDYTLVWYRNNSTKIMIWCNKHQGFFWQTPNDHLNGHRCKTCSYNGRMDKILNNKAITFEKDIQKIHKNDFDFTMVWYRGRNVPVLLWCNKHQGFIWRKPNSLLNGNGCGICANRISNTTIFIEKAKKVKNNIVDYNYTLVWYQGTKIPIMIWCNKHQGFFWQTPNDHLNGHGCRECALSGFNDQTAAILYYIKDIKTGYYKIGITNHNLKTRFNNNILKTIRILNIEYFTKGSDARDKERQILEEFSNHRVINTYWPENKGGKTEFFDRDVLNLEFI